MPDSQDPRPPTELERQIAKHLVLARKRAGFETATAAAAAMAYPRPQSIGDWETTGRLSTESLVMLCRTYRCSTDWVLGLNRLPDIKGAGGGIIDRAAEQAIRDAETIDALQETARDIDAYFEPETSGGILFAYATPLDFEVCEEDEFVKRRDAGLATIRKLLRKGSANEVRDGSTDQTRDRLATGQTEERRSDEG